MISSVGFIGSGNVATQLSKAFQKAGLNVDFVYSPNQKNAQFLAHQIGCDSLGNLNKIPIVDAIFLCVNDDYISELSQFFEDSQSLIIHTSGAADISVLSSNKNHGVFYPFQSISKSIMLNWNEVPLMIEGSSKENLFKLKALASSISNEVIEADSEMRRTLHLAGVLVNNFTNHLAHLSFNLLKEKKLSNSLLYPLIEETTRKILLGAPDKTQTGPAIRNDQKTIDSHLKLLGSKNELSAIYTLLTKSIQEHN